MSKQVSKGSLALSQCGRTHKVIATSIRSTEAAVSYWSRGVRTPSSEFRAELQRFLGIPFEAWDDLIEPTPAKPTSVKPDNVVSIRPNLAHTTPSPTLTTEPAQLAVKVVTPKKRITGPGATLAFAQELLEEQHRMHDELAQDRELTYHERAKVYAVLQGNLKKLGDMTGEFLPSESRILQTPQWRAIESTVLKALIEYPEAMESVVKALTELNNPTITH